MSHLRLTKSSSFIAKHCHDVSACVQKCFANTFSTVIAQMHETLCNLTGDCDKTAYIINTWRGCGYDYIGLDVTTRTPVALNRHDQRLGTLEHLSTGRPNDESAKEPTNMFAAIQIHVNKAMEELAKAITEHDRRFACVVIPVGSAYEGTKIGCCDEFDYNFVLTNLSSICEVCYSPESPPGFVQLKASTPVYDEDVKDLFDQQSGILNTRLVKFKFETLAKQVLSSKRFSDLTDFEFINPVSVTHLGLTRGNVATKLNTHVQLTFTKPVNKCHVLHTISIDLVPALCIKDWWPEGARRKKLCRTGYCLIVFTQPQSKYPWIGWTEPHGFISFARAESRLLRESRPVVKAAYSGCKAHVRILLSV